MSFITSHNDTDHFSKEICEVDSLLIPKTMNEVFKNIYQRRAVRKYKDKPVERATIETLIDAGRMAPSAINIQPWKFYILTKKEDIRAFSKEIAKASAKGFLKSGIKNIVKTASSALHLSHGIDFFKGQDPIFHGAPLVIFISSPKDNEWSGLDIGMCAQNMMLAAKSLGIDSCPVGLGKFVEQTKIFPKLHIPKAERVNISLIFGYGDEKPAIHERIKNNAFYL
ncbi:MAG: nitroreductase family protein [Bacteroidetes bacterium]|nr:MAG: nitroreductase family protein [Bacteroidota bacterium]